MGDYNPTPNPLGITAPDGADPIRNGDNQFRNLVDALSANLAIVTTLPGSPEDGQIVYFQDATLAAEGIVWQLRYNAASASAYKWEFFGGGQIIDRSPSGASGITAGGSFAAPSDGYGPSITVPLAGEYVISYGMSVDGDALANSSAEMAPKVGGASPSFNDACRAVIGFPTSTVSAWGGSLARTKDITAAASDVVQAYYSGSGGHAIYQRWMTLVPIRVG
ncbi:MAG: hypothetical protein ACSLFR_08715 [Solirubrobacteraceae bacterium]